MFDCYCYFIARLQSIAASEKQQEYEDNVKALKLTKLYENNVLFRNWMDKFWLTNAKVYANLFQAIVVLYVNYLLLLITDFFSLFSNSTTTIMLP